MTRILGVPFSKKDKRETVNFITATIDAKPKKLAHVVTANPEIVMYATKSKGYRKILKHADLITPDGIGIIWASKILDEPLKERVTGIDTTTSVFESRAKEGKTVRVYLLGASKEYVKNAVSHLENTYPYVRVVGYHNGYYNRDKEHLLVNEINRCKPDMLLVGLGFPRQDQFIFNYSDKLRVSVAMGVGGAFDIWGGKLKRAPKPFRDMGFEWIWRLLIEPKRIFRQLKLIRFIKAVKKSKRDEFE